MDTKEIISHVKNMTAEDLENYIHDNLKARVFKSYQEELESVKISTCIYGAEDEDAAFNFIVCGYNPETKELEGQFASGNLEGKRQKMPLKALSFIELLELSLHLN